MQKYMGYQTEGKDYFLDLLKIRQPKDHDKLFQNTLHKAHKITL